MKPRGGYGRYEKCTVVTIPYRNRGIRYNKNSYYSHDGGVAFK